MKNYNLWDNRANIAMIQSNKEKSNTREVSVQIYYMNLPNYMVINLENKNKPGYFRKTM